MGNFESCRVDIGIEDSVRQGEHIDTAFSRVYDYAEKRLIEKVTDLENEITKVKG